MMPLWRGAAGIGRSALTRNSAGWPCRTAPAARRRRRSPAPWQRAQAPTASGVACASGDARARARAAQAAPERQVAILLGARGLGSRLGTRPPPRPRRRARCAAQAGMPVYLMPFLTIQNSSAVGHSRAAVDKSGGGGSMCRAHRTDGQAGRAVAIGAAAMEMPGAERIRSGSSRGGLDAERVGLHRVAHAEGQEPFHDRPVAAARRDAVDAGPGKQHGGNQENNDTGQEKPEPSGRGAQRRIPQHGTTWRLPGGCVRPVRACPSCGQRRSRRRARSSASMPKPSAARPAADRPTSGLEPCPDAGAQSTRGAKISSAPSRQTSLPVTSRAKIACHWAGSSGDAPPEPQRGRKQGEMHDDRRKMRRHGGRLCQRRMQRPQEHELQQRRHPKGGGADDSRRQGATPRGVDRTHSQGRRDAHRADVQRHGQRGDRAASFAV